MTLEHNAVWTPCQRKGGEEGRNAVDYNTILVVVTSDRDFWSQRRSKRCDTSPKDRSALLPLSGLSHWWEQCVGSTTFVQIRGQISAVDSMGNLTGVFSWLPYCFINCLLICAVAVFFRGKKKVLCRFHHLSILPHSQKGIIHKNLVLKILIF